MSEKMYLGVDIGGTAVKIGKVTEEGTVLETESYAVNFDGYETPILQTVIKSCRKFMNRYGMDQDNCPGIGVSATGAINTKTGCVDGSAGHIRNWEHSRIKESIEREFGIRTSVINDANAAALGEVWTGAARNRENVVVITIGTGVGGGIITDGKILLGRDGFAGEIGHIPIQISGERCSCGNRGCLERYGSASALVRDVRNAVSEGRINHLSEDEIDGRKIVELADHGDNVILEIIDRWIGCIASGIVGLVHIFNPELILIGGGVSAQEKYFISPLQKKVKESVMPHFARGLELRSADLGNEAGLVGAVYYFIQTTECNILPKNYKGI